MSSLNIRGPMTVADGSITTAKLANNAVDVTKITQDLATQHIVGTEIPLSSSVQAETAIGNFNFTIAANNNEAWKSFGYSVLAKSSINTNTVTVRLYIDGTQIGTDQTTTATVDTLLSVVSVDISSLAVGNHLVELRLLNSSSGQTGTIDKWDNYLGKK